MHEAEELRNGKLKRAKPNFAVIYDHMYELWVDNTCDTFKYGFVL